MENKEFFIKAKDMTAMEIVPETEVGRFAFIQTPKDIVSQFSKFEILALMQNIRGSRDAKDNKKDINALAKACYRGATKNIKSPSVRAKNKVSKMVLLREAFSKKSSISQEDLCIITGHTKYSLQMAINLITNSVITTNPLNIEFSEDSKIYNLKK